MTTIGFQPLPLPELTEEFASTLLTSSRIPELVRRLGMENSNEVFHIVDDLQNGLWEHFIHEQDLATIVRLANGDLRIEAKAYIADEVDEFIATRAAGCEDAARLYLLLSAWDVETLDMTGFIAERQRQAIAVRITNILWACVTEMLTDSTGYRTDLAADLAHYGFSIA